MKVSLLLERLEYTCCQGSTEQEVSAVVYDSRKVTEDSLFVCIRGAVVDGHKFIPDVIARGARTLVVEDHETEKAVQESSSRPIASNPRTTDRSETGLWTAAAVTAAITARVSVRRRQGNERTKTKH